MKKRNKMLLKASDYFAQKEYEHALHYYAMVLQEDPSNAEARTGAMLADMAISQEEGALALYDYYSVLLASDKELAHEIVQEIILAMDGSMHDIHTILNSFKEGDMELEDGITYSDFKELVKSRGSFKRAFEDVMFSTRVMITSKEDFIDFLGSLTANGFEEMALSYVESAISSFPNDERILDIFRQLGNYSSEG